MPLFLDPLNTVHRGTFRMKKIVVNLCYMGYPVLEKLSIIFKQYSDTRLHMRTFPKVFF